MIRLPVFVLVFVPLSLLYVSTATWDRVSHIDPLTNSLTAWHLGVTGSVVMPGHAEAASPDYQGNVGWIFESPRGPVGQYPPGTAALAAPVYWMSGQPMDDFVVTGLNRPQVDPILFPLPSFAPATIAAALSTAAALGFMAAAIPIAGGSRFGAVVAGYVGGLGTTFWATASDALWQHGPASMWVALAIYLAARSQLVWSGLAFGAAVITRPHLAVIAAAVGLYVAIQNKDFRPALKIGAGSLLGLGVLLTYNWWVWGRLSIAGGYSDQFVARLVSTDAWAYLQNIAGALVDPTRGLLTYSPWLLLLIPGLAAGWRSVPGWARGAAVGGLAYLLIQLKANRFSGGDGFLGYRYPLEALAAAGVLFYFAYVRWTSRFPMTFRLFWVAAALSVVPGILWKLGALPGAS